LARYRLSKLATVLWTKKLQREFDTQGVPITAISLHPGLVSTGAPALAILFRRLVINFVHIAEGTRSLPMPLLLRPIFRYIYIPLKFASVEKGVYTSLFAAAGKKVKEEPENYQGAYLDPVAQLSEPSVDASKEELADDLWKLTNQILTDAQVL
jgi:hypothetical protein